MNGININDLDKLFPFPPMHRTMIDVFSNKLVSNTARNLTKYVSLQLHDYTVYLKCDSIKDCIEGSKYMLILFALLGQGEYTRCTLLNLHLLKYHQSEDTSIWRELKAASLLNEEAGEIYLSTFSRITSQSNG